MSANLDSLNAALSGRYTIDRELGAGGMATVYLAHDVRHDRKVALKVLRPELSAILGAARFLTEIKTTANLQHPHILSLFDSGEADGTVFYVMPYVDGESLRDRIKREHQLPIDEALRIAREILDALEYAHKQGIVHRDIKPENILLHGGHAMVADFGIALAASRSEGGTRMTETGMSLGTPHYMSPEQAMGDKEITGRADVYAAGAVLYEMLTGEPPFVGATAQAIFARVLTDEPRSLTIQRKTVPPHIADAVNVSLQKLPADRFASAAEFADALSRNTGTTLGTRARAAATGSRASAGQRALTLVPWVLFAVAAALALFATLKLAPRPVSRLTMTLWDHPVTTFAIPYGLAIAPDGDIVFRDTVGGRQLWGKEAGQLAPSAITGTGGASMPALSPDGAWIAFESGGKLRKVPRLGGSPTTIADSMNAVFPAIAWLDNGQIAYNDVEYSLRTVPQDGGPSRKWIRADSLGRGAVSITALPNGRGLLVGECTVSCQTVKLMALDFRSGALHDLGDDIVKAWHTSLGQVVYVRRDGGVFAGPFDLSRFAFVTAPVPVLEGVRATPANAEFALSADGTVLYEAGPAVGSSLRSELVWVGRDGKSSLVSDGWNFDIVQNHIVSLSPDGRRLAVAIVAGSTSDIWIKQLDQGPLTRLTFAGINDRPVWTADGRSILYTSIAGPDKNQDLYVRKADGTGVEQLLLDIPRVVVEVIPLRDTSRYIVRIGTPGTRDITTWQRGAKDVTPLIADAKASEGVVSLSPDGRWLAYVSDESGRAEVYVRPFPNVDAGKWQVSRAGGQEPLWAHSGRELFYRDAKLDLISVAITPGAAFNAGEQRVLFATAEYQQNAVSRRVYDITPDDRRFLFTRTVGAQAVRNTAPRLVRVDNWFTELGASRRRP